MSDTRIHIIERDNRRILFHLFENRLTSHEVLTARSDEKRWGFNYGPNHNVLPPSTKTTLAEAIEKYNQFSSPENPPLYGQFFLDGRVAVYLIENGRPSYFSYQKVPDNQNVDVGVK